MSIHFTSLRAVTFRTQRKKCPFGHGTEQFHQHFKVMVIPVPDLYTDALSGEILHSEPCVDFVAHWVFLLLSLTLSVSCGLPSCDTVPSVTLAVEAGLQRLLSSPPSLEEFSAAIENRNGRSSGGHSGLLYDHLKD